MKEGHFRITNSSQTYSIQNAYVACSHPLLVNFENTCLFRSLDKGNSFDLPLTLRACLLEEISVKFLVRYEVGDESIRPAETAREIPAMPRQPFRKYAI